MKAADILNAEDLIGEDVVTPEQVKELTSGDTYTKLFQSLLPEAAKQVRRILKNSQSEKIVLAAAQDIFDRAGASKKGLSDNRPIIEIKDSNVQLLVQAAKEALE